MTRERAKRLALGLLAAVMALSTPSSAPAAQTVKLTASLTPEHLGKGTTIGFGFKITTPAHQAPPPLTGVEISYPVNLGFALSELGLETCTEATLEAEGPEGCPTNSLMGYGTATAEIAISNTFLYESARLTIVRAPTHNGHLSLLISADAGTPVNAQIAFPGLILPASAPYGGRLNMNIPLVPSVPGGPDVAVVQFSSTLGPQHLHYIEERHDQLISYQPKGIPLPHACPHQGFRFSATFSFLDNSHAEAATVIPCPSGKGHHHRHH